MERGAASRRGFTLIEVLIASGVASTLIAVLYSTLIFYTRSATREDASLERSRRSQVVLTAFREDFERATGTLGVEDIPADVLLELGFGGTPTDLMSLPRVGVNLINGYTSFTTTSPYLSRGFEFIERWDFNDQGGKRVFRYNPAVSTYGTDGPNEGIRKAVPPRGALGAVIHVLSPPERPVSEFWVMRKASAGQTAIVIWAYHKTAVGRYSPGTLLRWTAGPGTTRIGGNAPVDFRARFLYDWMFVDSAPPRRPAATVRLLSSMARVEVGLPLPGEAMKPPGAERDASAYFLVGP